jgi:hypothetical protein
MASLEQDMELQEAMTALNSLISGKKRKDGKTWKDAFEYMQVYLEVNAVVQAADDEIEILQQSPYALECAHAAFGP